MSERGRGGQQGWQDPPLRERGGSRDASEKGGSGERGGGGGAGAEGRRSSTRERGGSRDASGAAGKGKRVLVWGLWERGRAGEGVTGVAQQPSKERGQQG